MAATPCSFSSRCSARRSLAADSSGAVSFGRGIFTGLPSRAHRSAVFTSQPLLSGGCSSRRILAAASAKRSSGVTTPTVTPSCVGGASTASTRTTIPPRHPAFRQASKCSCRTSLCTPSRMYLTYIRKKQAERGLPKYSVWPRVEWCDAPVPAPRSTCSIATTRSPPGTQGPYAATAIFDVRPRTPAKYSRHHGSGIFVPSTSTAMSRLVTCHRSPSRPKNGDEIGVPHTRSVFHWAPPLFVATPRHPTHGR